MSEVSGTDDYVAWLTFRKKDGTHSDGRIRICDSDSPGAFKVYRAAPISAVLEADETQLDAERYRWLRSHPVFQVKELPNELELLDASIDRYMAGQETEE